jgi:hypothetical protein
MKPVLTPRFSVRDVLGVTLKAAKYLPAVVCGLLVVAWVVTLNGIHLLQSPSCKGNSLLMGVGSGSVLIAYGESDNSTFRYGLRLVDADRYSKLGNLQFDALPSVLVPIALLLTALSPISAAILFNLRFPLWSYFAWTALVALELAFYLR